MDRLLTWIGYKALDLMKMPYVTYETVETKFRTTSSLIVHIVEAYMKEPC